MLNPIKALRCLLSLVVAAILLGGTGTSTSTVLAQSARLELGRRLQRFENAWESAAADRRTAAVNPLKVAVNSFFSLRLAEAGRQLDQAWVAVRGPADPPSTLEQAVIGLQLLPQPICADVSHAGLKIQLKPFYETESPPPPSAALLLAIHDSAGKILAETSIPLNKALEGTTWELPPLPPGDHLLKAGLHDGPVSFALPNSTISRIPELTARIENLQGLTKSAAAATDDYRQSVLQATLKSTAATAVALQQGRLQETDYPIFDRLTLCEQMTAATPPPDLLLQHSRSRDLWLTLARGNKAVPTRIRAPANHPDRSPYYSSFMGQGEAKTCFSKPTVPDAQFAKL
ncbi:MAG UNVERIFIED_CONTAM: hypothetical protein LVR18_05495 [Planctomycetaceae bacterium]